MGNWFSDNPATSIVGYTISVAVVTAAVTIYFTQDAVRMNFQASMQAKNDSIEVLKARIDYLEKDSASDKETIKQLTDWLGQTPNSYIALKNEIAMLKRHLSEGITSGSPDASTTIASTLYYRLSPQIEKGGSYRDDKTGAMLGISEINTEREGAGTLSLPGQPSKKIEKLAAGQAWTFEKDGKTYQIAIRSLDFITSKFQVDIRQTK